MADVTDTPDETLDAATETNALPKGELALLGTFVKPEGAEALILTPKGEVATVTPGDSLGGERVMAIEEGVIVLAEGGHARKLEMPGG